MSFHIKDDFKAGAPISQVPASWFNSVAKFLNGLIGGFGIETKKNESGRSTIALRKQTLQQEIDNITQNLRISKDSGTPDDHTDSPTVLDTSGDSWSWTADGANGIEIDAYYKCAESGSYHYLQRCRMTFSKDGLLVKAQGLPDRIRIRA